MNRSPLYYPMARGGDSEAGGAADLQTDVMRFMAILSLCLMVIFAVVQSVPVEAIPKPPAPIPQAEIPTESKIEAPAPVAVQQVAVESHKPLEPPSPSVQQTINTPSPPVAETAAGSADQEGFTLRFETDLALTQLVSRNEIGLYAITEGKALRMTINQDKAEFWSASLPTRFHEMDTATVPDAVIRAFQRSINGNAAGTQWGVTLPTVMSTKLNTYMQDSRGGALVIGADGILRMEH